MNTPLSSRFRRDLPLQPDVAAKSHDHPRIAGQLSFLDESFVDPMPVPADPATQPPSAPVVRPNSAGSSSDVQPDGEIITGPNTRVRASNAMHRAREAAVQGAIAVMQRKGIKGLTMVEAADRGGMARATLYNHVRDKEQLLELVLDHETRSIARAFVEADSLRHALEGAATAVADHPALAGVRAHDAASVPMLTAANDPRLRRLVGDCLNARGNTVSDANVDLLVRWLASFAAVPSDADTRSVQAAAMAKLLG